MGDEGVAKWHIQLFLALSKLGRRIEDPDELDDGRSRTAPKKPGRKKKAKKKKAKKKGAGKKAARKRGTQSKPRGKGRRRRAGG